MFKPNSNRAQPVPAKKDHAGPTRLAQIWTEPTLVHVEDMLELAKKNGGYSVEQPFSVSGQDALFQISVIRPENSDPVWKFQSGSLTGLTEVWSLPSVDVELIHNLVLSECTGQKSVDLISATSAMSRSSTGNMSLGPTEGPETEAKSQSASSLSQMQSLVANQTKSDKSSKQSISLEGDLEIYRHD